MATRSNELDATGASDPRSWLFVKKPMNMLLAEAGEAGEHSLKRSLGAGQLTALGVGAVIGAGIFVLSGLGAHYAGPALMLSFIISGLGCAFAGLCYAEFAAMIPLAGSAYTYAYATLGEFFAWIIGWDLTLEYAMGASTVSSGWSNHFIELLNIFHVKMPLWLAYDHWTGLNTATKIVARQMARASDATLQPGTQAFLDKVDAIMKAQSAELAQQAHAMLNAPTIFGSEIGFNLPAFVIALVITAILVIGIKESARFNATIVTIKVGVVLFVIGLGIHYINFSNWGHDWSSFAPMGVGGIGAGAAYIIFAYIGFDAVSTTAQECKNPQRDLPIGIMASLLICTLLYILVAGVLTGMVRWQDVNIEAPIAVAFLDRGLNVASHIITVGSLAAIVGSITPIDDIGKMVNIGTLLAFIMVCIAVMILRRTNPQQPRPFRTPWVPAVPILGIIFNGYMMYKLGWINWARLIIWLVIGLVIYFAYSRYHSRVRSALAK